MHWTCLKCSDDEQRRCPWRGAAGRGESRLPFRPGFPAPPSPGGRRRSPSIVQTMSGQLREVSSEFPALPYRWASLPHRLSGLWGLYPIRTPRNLAERIRQRALGGNIPNCPKLFGQLADSCGIQLCVVPDTRSACAPDRGGQCHHQYMSAPTVDTAINDLLDWACHAVYELLAAKDLLGEGLDVGEYTGMSSWVEGPDQIHGGALHGSGHPFHQHRSGRRHHLPPGPSGLRGSENILRHRDDRTPGTLISRNPPTNPMPLRKKNSRERPLDAELLPDLCRHSRGGPADIPRTGRRIRHPAGPRRVPQPPGMDRPHHHTTTPDVGTLNPPDSKVMPLLTPGSACQPRIPWAMFVLSRHATGTIGK